MATFNTSTVVESKDSSGVVTLLAQGALSADFVLGSETLNCAPYVGAVKSVSVKLLDHATYTVVEDYANSTRSSGVVSLAIVRLDNHAGAPANTNLSSTATLEVEIKGLFN